MGRTLKLMMFLQSPEEYTAKYGMGLQDSQQMGNKLNGEDGQQALLDIQQLQQGQRPNDPQNPTPEYLDAFNQFLQSPEFAQLPPEIQQLIQDFVQNLIVKAEQSEEQSPGNQFGQEGSPTQSPQKPSPQSTSAVPTNPPELAQGSPRKL